MCVTSASTSIVHILSRRNSKLVAMFITRRLHTCVRPYVCTRPLSVIGQLEGEGARGGLQLSAKHRHYTVTYYVVLARVKSIGASQTRPGDVYVEKKPLTADSAYTIIVFNMYTHSLALCAQNTTLRFTL